MPPFRALPPSLRPAKPRPPTPTRNPQLRRSTRSMVDCGVYVEGMRLPGKFTQPRPPAKVREIQQTGRTRSPGLACTSPTSTRCRTWQTFSSCTRWPSKMPCVAHQRPKLERYDDTMFLVLKTVNYVPARIGRIGPRNRRVRRDHDFCRPGFRRHCPAWWTRRALRGAQADGRRPRACRGSDRSR